MLRGPAVNWLDEQMKDRTFRWLYRWEGFKLRLGMWWAWLRNEPYCWVAEDGQSWEWRGARSNERCDPPKTKREGGTDGK